MEKIFGVNISNILSEVIKSKNFWNSFEYVELVLQTKYYDVVKAKTKITWHENSRTEVRDLYWLFLTGRGYRERDDVFPLGLSFEPEFNLVEIDNWYFICFKTPFLELRTSSLVHKDEPFIYHHLMYTYISTGKFLISYTIFRDWSADGHGSVYKCIDKRSEKVKDLQPRDEVEIPTDHIYIYLPRVKNYTTAVNQNIVVRESGGCLTTRYFITALSVDEERYDDIIFEASGYLPIDIHVFSKIYYHPFEKDCEKPCKITWPEWPKITTPTITPSPIPTATPTPTLVPSPTPTLPTSRPRLIVVKLGKVMIKISY